MRFKLDASILRAVVYGKTTVITQGLNLLTISIVVRALGNEPFGVYQYALGLASMALMVGHFGTDAIAFREFSMPLRQACGALPRILVIRLGGISVALIMMWSLVQMGVFQVSSSLYAAVAATATAESFLRVGNGWHRARHLVWLDFWTSISRSLLVLVLVSIIVPRHPNAFGIALAYGSGAAVILASLFWQWRRILRIGWSFRYPWKRLLNAAPSFFYLDLAGNLFGTIPIFVLGHHQRFEEIGRYSIYSKYLAPFALAGTQYVQALQPSLVQAFHRRVPVRALLMRGAMTVTGAGLLGIVGALSAGTAAVFYLGHQRPLDITLLLILAAFPAILGWVAFTGAVLISARLERPILVARSVGLATCCLASLLLWQEGAIGAAIAVVLASASEVLASALIGLPILFRKTEPCPGEP